MRIKIHDELPPEANAMLQALYSRSSKSVEHHLIKVRERGPENFMASYYVGYGHASIGDCGYTTLYIEDVSILACKAIQDNPLYSGQETSTRYIDFSERAVVDPINTHQSNEIIERWMQFYRNAEPILLRHLQETIEKPTGQSESVWQKAIAARCFDILRGFLPAGVTSQLSWTTNFRQAHEHSLRLLTHPLAEVRTIGEGCLDLLRHRYSNSFGHEVTSEALEYLRMVGRTETYVAPSHLAADFQYNSTIDNNNLESNHLDIIASRPRKQVLPKNLSHLGTYRCQFMLDFGSFRDLQRHRGGICRMPLLTDAFGLHPWYLEQLPPKLRVQAQELSVQQHAVALSLKQQGVSDADLQYVMPIGMMVSCEIIYDLPQMVYVAELRSGLTTHPTLRMIAHAMATAIQREHPKLILYIDERRDFLSIRRGSQDIIDLGVSGLKLAG
ncbi:FAD-dependent thymidylate synthase [Methylobacterium sp. Gmos1]